MLKQLVYFFKAVKFWPTFNFDIQTDITWAIFREKLQKHTS